jgi:hypothetical protein
MLPRFLAASFQLLIVQKPTPLELACYFNSVIYKTKERYFMSFENISTHPKTLAPLATMVKVNF